MTVDVHTLIGGFPFRHIPHPEAEVLVRVLSREGVQSAWTGHLPSAYYRDPTPGNEALYEALEPHARVLRPVPTIRPDWPGWEGALEVAAQHRAPAVRAYPPQWGMGPHDDSLAVMARACGELGMALVLTTRFEDMRQRHWLDAAGDLSGATIRALARVAPNTRILVLAAGRALIEEVHWGLTESERSRVWWDISWLWGPPEDELARLLRSIGASRFVYGSGWPLRLPQTPRANLELLPADLRAVRLADPALLTAALA
jgi:hypothetical protein